MKKIVRVELKVTQTEFVDVPVDVPEDATAFDITERAVDTYVEDPSKYDRYLSDNVDTEIDYDFMVDWEIADA